MLVKDIIDTDTVNYKKLSMFIATTKCSFKCDKEAGCQVCQNSSLANAPIIDIDNNDIIKRYLDNPITEAVVIGGLESFDTFEELYQFIKLFRDKSNDDIIIYTGYYPNEIKNKVEKLYNFKNIYIKFGRFIPNYPHKFDEILGVELSSNNQFTLPINKMEQYYEQRKNI